MLSECAYAAFFLTHQQLKFLVHTRELGPVLRCSDSYLPAASTPERQVRVKESPDCPRLQFNQLAASLVRDLHSVPRNHRAAHPALAHPTLQAVSACQPRKLGEPRNARSVKRLWLRA